MKHISGENEIRSYDAPASTAFDFNDVVTRDANGRLAKATATTPRSELLGLIQLTILSTDDDYTDVKTVPVLLFNDPEGEFEASVSTGTAVQAMVGTRIDLDDEDSLDVNSNLQKCFEITRIISTTSVRGKFVTAGDKMRLVSYQQVVAFDDFTDGGSTVGTLDLGVSIPVGAVFQRTLINDVTEFAGDTSATLTIGDGTDVDRYNTSTVNVFATADALDAGAASGTLFHSAAKTPKLTVTTNADFTSVTAGQLTVTLFWLQAE